MRRALLLVAVVAIVLAVAIVALSWMRAQTFPVAALATRVPARTALMRERQREARAAGRRFRADRRWVPYARIAPVLRRAVLVAEDDAFFAHGGLDWSELGAAAREDLKKRRIVRGGSTITQQLAKNLFLGDARTPFRKLTEMFLAFRLEGALTKRRIFELYLNTIEWGDGIYGVEAASRRYFHVEASDLNPRQAVLLAAVIINPHRYTPIHPGRRIERRARMIADRLHHRGRLDDEAWRIAIGAPPPIASEPPDTSAAPVDTSGMPRETESDSTAVDTAGAIGGG